MIGANTDDHNSSTLDDTMSKLSNKKLPCIVAGDLNIDLTKCSTNKNTAYYVNSVLANNFIPTILMPTRITANSATLIDHGPDLQIILRCVI